MEAKETLKIISKQWCTTEDLKMITGLGKNSVLKLKPKIRFDLIVKGYSLPSKLLPMNEVVKYLKIDIDYLTKINETNFTRKEE